MLEKNILDYIRISLYVLMIFIIFSLYQAWEKENVKPEPAMATPQITSTVPISAMQQQQNVQQSAAANTAPQPNAAAVVPQDTTGELIKVTTDKLILTIDTRGGDIVSAQLIDYPESLGSSTPFQLLDNSQKEKYIAESGLLSKQGPDTTEAQGLYQAAQSSYQLTPEQKDLVVPLTWTKDGVTVTKTFTFVRGSYETRVAYTIENHTQQNWEGNVYTQLLRTNTPPASHGGLMNLATFFGAAVSTPQKPFEKITFKQMQENNLSQSVQDGWVAMIQHYFISAWVPPKGQTFNYYTRVLPNGLYSIGMVGPSLTVPAGGKVTTEAKLYTGPTIATHLEQVAPHLNLTIDYGWFWFISGIIFWMMQKIYDVVGNWGWAIVLVTIVIKLLFYQLSAKSYRSMSGLKKLQPRIEMLKERYGDDKQKLTQATLELYRTEKVNPMSGCLPILIQIPVFIALYWVLVESVQLRQAPFILWIHDLSQQDPYYVLPVLMGISMFIQQRLNPPPPDPMQAKIMMMMPIVFTILFVNFPAGLMLYWFVNNTLSFLQQWFIMRQMETAKK